MNTRIMVDSTFNLDADFIKENDITVIPLNVIIDNVSYQDQVNVNFEEVMEAVNQNKHVSTSQPSPLLFQEYFEKLRDEGTTDILCLTISSTLSGTYQAACLAAKEVQGVRVHVIDTLSASIGSEIIATVACEEINKGTEFNAIIDKLTKMTHNSGIYLCMENLTALKKSGRINRIKATIGNLLRVKPVIEYIGAKVNINAKIRTDSQLIEWIIEKMKAVLGNVTSKIYIFVAHIHAKDRILRIKKSLEEVFPNIIIKLRDGITPVIAVNIGYGGVGVAWCYE